MGDPAGEADRGALRLDFDRRLMLQFRGAAITSDAGLLAYRELDDTVGLTNTSDEHAIWPIRRFEKQLREGSLYSTPGAWRFGFAGVGGCARACAPRPLRNHAQHGGTKAVL